MEELQASVVETQDENGVVAPMLSKEKEAESEMGCEEFALEEPQENAEIVQEPVEESVQDSDTQGEEKRTFLQAEYQALQAAFPGEIPFSDITEFSQLGAFLSLREKGLTSRQAYLAVEGERKAPASATAHLRAAAPRVVAPGTPAIMPRNTLMEWQRMFPHLSIAEIRELYIRTAPYVD